MAAFPSDNTARLWLLYTVAGQEHDLMFRFNTVGDAVAALPALQELAEALAPRMHTNVTFTGAEYSDVGSGVRNPLPFDSVLGTEGSAMAARNAPRYLSWYGRDGLGSKVRYYLYGAALAAEVAADYRYQPEEDANVDALSDDILQFIDAYFVVTISNNPPVMRDYVNVGYNRHYQDKARTG